MEHGSRNRVISSRRYHTDSDVRGHGCKLRSSHVDPALLLRAEEETVDDLIEESVSAHCYNSAR